jgi:hypothetical protein
VVEAMVQPIVAIQNRPPFLDGGQYFPIFVSDPRHFIFLSRALKRKRSLRDRTRIVLLADDFVHFAEQAAIVPNNFAVSL